MRPPAAWFEGTYWLLVPSEQASALRPSATFESGTVAGSTGCNRFSADYTVDGASIRIGLIASTRMACPPPADEVERAYLGALELVAGWRRDGESLVLVDADGADLLRYTAETSV